MLISWIRPSRPSYIGRMNLNAQSALKVFFFVFLFLLFFFLGGGGAAKLVRVVRSGVTGVRGQRPIRTCSGNELQASCSLYTGTAQ